MEITYIGHSCFRLKGKQGTVITDPFNSTVGLKIPSMTADVVTVSHDHPDHNNIKAVSPTPRRERPWYVTEAGEYEVSEISIFGFQTFHDDQEGKERGNNNIYKIVMDGVHIVHLGDLGHQLSDKIIEEIGTVDVLLCPVGGVYTIDAKGATEVIQEMEPSYIIPMHYRTPSHAEQTYGKLGTVEDFEKVFGVTVDPVKSLTVNSGSMPEQTTLVVLEN